MPPINHQSEPVSNSGLPLVPATPQSPAVAQPVSTPLPMDASGRVVAQAKQIVAQYSGDPYKLSEALSQLKNAYLTDQFHITPIKAEN